jgi:uncharacterized membrane protein HdeD (DUF308 family)
LFGFGCAVVGIVILFRPFTSLSVLIVLASVAMIATGLTTLTTQASVGRWTWVSGTAWVAAGVLVLVWPGLSIRVSPSSWGSRW